MTETFASPPPGVLTRNAHAGPAGEYLSFRLGVEEYGIDILRVQEIRSYERPTRLAHSPDFIKGVIDLRGRIVPIEALLGSGEIELVTNATRG